MIAFQQTIVLVTAMLCLSGSDVSAQTDTTARLAQSAATAGPVFRLVLIGGQPLLTAQDYSNTSGEADETVSGQCLIAMLNFFLEVPREAPAAK